MNHRATRLRTIAILAAASTTTLAFAAARGGDPVGGDGTVAEPNNRTTWPSFESGDTPDFYVADSSESIQDAIDAAQDWDIIELGPDEWIENLDFHEKAIWLITFEGAQLRRVTSEGSSATGQIYPTLTQYGNPTNQVHLRLSNLAFVGDDDTNCLQAAYATVEVIACSFTNWNNLGPGWNSGAALGFLVCNATVQNCSFEHCVGRAGGAVYSCQSTLAVSDSTFEYCASVKGGAIVVHHGQPVIERNTFRSCTSEPMSFRDNDYLAAGGGALYVATNAPVIISECHFENNQSEKYGGAIQFETGEEDPGPVIISACRFENNRAKYSGGAIESARHGSLTISNSAFVKNKAQQGAAIYAQHLQMNRCVLTGNESCLQGQSYPYWIISVAVLGDVTESRFCGNTMSNFQYGEEGDVQFRGGTAGNTDFYDDVDYSKSWINPGFTNLTCNMCQSDLDIDGTVGITELLFLLNDWGKVSVLQDADGDRFISASDLVSLLADWGPCSTDPFDGVGDDGSTPIDLPF